MSESGKKRKGDTQARGTSVVTKDVIDGVQSLTDDPYARVMQYAVSQCAAYHLACICVCVSIIFTVIFDNFIFVLEIFVQQYFRQL